jgi:hypothetical protein
LSGNSSVAGLEVEHTGVTPLPAHRIETACRITAALLEAPGSSWNARYQCQHFEWTPRKIDIATRLDTAGFRARVAYWIGRTADPPTPPQERPMFLPVLTVDGDPQRATYLVLDRSNKEILRLVDVPGITAFQRYQAGVDSGLYAPVRHVSVATYDRAAAECQRDGETA